MITEKIKFSAEFISPMGNRWLGIEGSLEPGEDEQQAWTQAKEKAEKWYMDNYPDGGANLPVKKIEIDYGANGNLANDIQSCKDLKILESYRLLVAKDEKLQGLYNQKHTELSNKTRIQLP